MPLTKEGARQWQRQFRKTPAGKRHVRNMNLKKYGLTTESYDEMLVAQGGRCASCGTTEGGRNQFGPTPLVVDHCHETGAVRGLLCMTCNRTLGLLADSVSRIEDLLRYRRRFE